MYTATVTLEQALTGLDVAIQTLDGRTLKVGREGGREGRREETSWCVLGLTITLNNSPPLLPPSLPSLQVSEPHVTPGTVKVLRGEGMPLQKSPDRKGNLKVKFNIVFPTLTETQKQEIKAVLKGGRG